MLVQTVIVNYKQRLYDYFGIMNLKKRGFATMKMACLSFILQKSKQCSGKKFLSTSCSHGSRLRSQSAPTCSRSLAFVTSPSRFTSNNVNINININSRLYSTSTDTAVAAPTTESYKHKQQLLHQATPLSLAPMMEYTDRHFRHLVRLISSNTLLYTEMVAANAIVHERNDALLRKDELIRPPPPAGSML